MAGKAPIEVFIDVFDLKEQRALVVPTLSPPDLVNAVLQEFRELEYLGTNKDLYRLVRVSDGAELAADRQLARLIQPQDRLAIQEVPQPAPAHGKVIEGRLYLREQPTGTVHKIHWEPAVIGRPDPAASNDLLAINLSSNANGLRVSRRHAQVTVDRGRYFVESLSPNPTTVTSTRNSITTTLLQGQKHLIEDGDMIVLDRSQITLKVIVGT